MARSFNPRTEALAFRIWAYCDPRGWDVSIVDLAERFQEPVARVRRVLQLKGWLCRVRKTSSAKGILYRIDVLGAHEAADHDPSAAMRQVEGRLL